MVRLDCADNGIDGAALEGVVGIPDLQVALGDVRSVPVSEPERHVGNTASTRALASWSTTASR